jgi:hypothetical protein
MEVGTLKCYSRKQTAINDLYVRFKPHGVPIQIIADIIDLGLQSGLTLEAAAIGARMTISEHYGFHEYFTIKDVMAVTGETEDEVMKRMEKCEADLIKQGKDPREYFPEVSFAPGYGGVQ